MSSATTKAHVDLHSSVFEQAAQDLAAAR